jgi:bifunctional non-homologous end joining protein LigD
MISKIIEGVKLACTSAGHDAVYNIWIQENPSGAKYSVMYENGRRGNALTPRPLLQTISLSEAESTYRATINKKTSSGRDRVYSIVGTMAGDPSLTSKSAPIAVMPGSTTVVGPGSPLVSPKAPKTSELSLQLLNPIPVEEVELFIGDKTWVMQEKFDGHRQALGFDFGRASAWNKKGQAIEPSPVFCSTLQKAFPEFSFILDGENCGDKYYAFDLLKLYGEPMLEYRYEDRLLKLGMLLRSACIAQEVIVLAETAYSAKEKQALFKRIKDEGREGIVLKKLDAKYMAGRPSKGGHNLKVPLVFHAACSIIKCNDKRSVEVGVMRGGVTRSMGNVSVPVSYEMPKPGDVVDVRYPYAYPDGCFARAVYLGPSDSDEIEDYDKLKFKAE